MAQQNKNLFRVVGGKWRSRRLDFADGKGLRPTLDRNRETLFNWLQGIVEGINVLDLYSGSGALGIEALSRGAQHCQFVDLNRSAVDQIQTNLKKLEAHNYAVNCADALSWLSQSNTKCYDLIFLDPPFADQLLQQTIDALSATSLLNKNALVYCEYHPKERLVFPSGWHVTKQKKTTAVAMVLVSVN